MNLVKKIGLLIGAAVLGALVSTSALAQVTTRFTVPGGAANSVKILPGQSAAFDVRVDSPANGLVGASFTILQSAPAVSSFFTITARDFTGSIFNDAASGFPDATVLALPSALLNPDNDDNLGRSTVGLVPAATGSNLFVEKLTLTSNVATPLNTYTIIANPANALISDTTTDFPMSPGDVRHHRRPDALDHEVGDGHGHGHRQLGSHQLRRRVLRHLSR